MENQAQTQAQNQ